MERREFLAGAGMIAAGGMLNSATAAEAKTSKVDPESKKALLWEDITIVGFNKAVKSTGGIVLVPLGCLEKHGPHLPLGTDSIVAHEICKRAAEKESAVVFPMMPFGMVEEVRHQRGTMSISAPTMHLLLDEMCSEFSRNGLKKIIFVNDHGGTGSFLANFSKSRLSKRYDYQCYTWFKHLLPEQRPEFARRLGMNKLPDMGHADIMETSEILAISPERVHMDRINVDNSRNLNRLGAYEKYGLGTSIAWYGARPNHFAGDPTGATAEVGEWLLETFSDTLAEIIRLVKADTVTRELLDEFYDYSDSPRI